MKKLSKLFDKNRAWAEKVAQQNPHMLAQQVAQQNPEYLWIGCSDSRVSADQIIDVKPGDVFVHRNVSNLVIHTDMNCLSVLEYAVHSLKVKHILVVGHYGCGGVKAAIEGVSHGFIDNWLCHIRDIKQKHWRQLAECEDDVAELDLLCEINALEQAYNVCNTTIVRKAWSIGQDLCVHAWVYNMRTGLLQDLSFTIDSPEALEEHLENAIQKLAQR
ncbi:carbonic anhydrase ['Osedax' symbiont bacterium Rs2_46_30_T18]|nr:carbonic anhydrase ['Osedax' symbiont bacterium Rs2_46_30_T18]